MAAPALQKRLDESLLRLDSILDQRLAREEQALAADNADREFRPSPKSASLRRRAPADSSDLQRFFCQLWNGGSGASR